MSRGKFIETESKLVVVTSWGWGQPPEMSTGELPGGWKVSKTSMVMITQPYKFNKHHRMVDLEKKYLNG